MGSAARDELIRIYRDDKIKDKLYPDAVHQFTFILAENGMKHKPEDCRVFTECTVFKAMALCDGLKEYSFDQYKEFDTILDAVDEDTLVVCDFWATWCGPCVYVAPLYHAISEEFKNAVFLKADVDKLSELSQKQKIEAMPTFKFYKNKKEIHLIQGADAAAVKEAVQKYSQ